MRGRSRKVAVLMRASVGLPRLSKAHLLGLLLAVGLFAAGCANGTYPLDFFYEMHYQQSYGSYEPPRLSPPEEAVPWTGKQLSTGANPFSGQELVRQQAVAKGARLFAKNCVFCHGTQGKGNGPVLERMRADYKPEFASALSPDLTSPEAGHAQDPQDINGAIVFGWITSGSGGVMPSFQKLLSVEQRWLLVTYLKGCFSPQAQPGCPTP